MKQQTLFAIVLAVCMLIAVPAMATTVGAQTAEDDDSDEIDGNEETVDESEESEDKKSDEQDTNDSDDSADGKASNESEDNDIAEFSFNATLENKTVIVSVEANDTALENATVTANSTDVGTTDEHGALEFDLENRSGLEISVTADDTTQTTTYEVVDGELLAQEDDEQDPEQPGPPEEMPDEAAEQVSVIHQLINAFRSGEFDRLGPIVSEAAGGGPPADAGNGSENAPAHAGNGSENAPAHAGNGSENAPAHAGNGSENAPDTASDGQVNASDTASNGQENGSQDDNGSPGNSDSDRSGGNGANSGNSGNGGGQP